MNSKTSHTRLLTATALALAAIGSLLAAACEVEFSPNAEWKDVPVVYCLLDQDDDTTWVRVERCFLGEGSIYDFGQIADSINYPVGSIDVRLLSYRNGTLQSTESLNVAMRPREDSRFASEPQPIYYTDTRLDEGMMYKLEVLSTADGSTLATTDAIQLIINRNSQLVTRPSLHDIFKFLGRYGAEPACEIEWNQLDGARRYKPMVRFYYGELGDTHYVDIPCPTVLTGNNVGKLSTICTRSDFLETIRLALKDDPNPKEYLKYVDLYITACDENMSLYLTSVSSGITINQTTDVYSNIEGGLGVFAARRTHLHKTIQADSSIVPPNGMQYMLEQLGVGFQ